MAAQSAELLGIVEAAYRRHFELAPARASVSFVGVEPIEILRFDEPGPAGSAHYLSLGMSRHPMTDPAASAVDEAAGPRAELLLSVSARRDELWRQLAILAGAPAVEAAVYQPGNRVDLGQPLVGGSRCTGGILAAGPLPPIVLPGLAEVQVLRLLPATATELAWSRVHGSDQLVARWQAAGVELADLLRDPVSLG